MMKSLGLGTKYLITRIFLALGDSISFFWLFRALQIFRKFDFQNATPAVIPNQTFIKSCILTKLSFPINIKRNTYSISQTLNDAPGYMLHRFDNKTIV